MKVVAGVVLAAMLYLAVTFAQVYGAARRDGAEPAQAIVVFGTAQYDGEPSPVLAARLDHAIDLYERDLAPVVVVTGGNQPGDRFTEAAASANYLLERGIPDEDVLREVSGTSSWQSLAAVAAFLEDRDINEVLLVSDPFHSLRISAMADGTGPRGPCLAHPNQPHLGPDRVAVHGPGDGCGRGRPHHRFPPPGQHRTRATTRRVSPKA